MAKEKRLLSKEQVLHIAKLANLKLTPAEVNKFQKQLSQILSYMEVLNKVKTDSVAPTSQVTGLENVFRKDEPEMSFNQKKALSGTKNKLNNYFKVKAILK